MFFTYITDGLKMKKPNILITNDDGVFAPGIRHLFNAIKPFANVTVVAPSKEQSGSSLSISIRNPLNIEKITWSSEETGIWSVSGTPSDCVKLALNVILQSPPDLILSGINLGTNAGRNVLYSGTIAGIIEGTLQGIPGIAFSVQELSEPRFDLIESYVPQIVNYVLKHPLPPGTLLNVNFPETSQGKISGIRMARQGKEFWLENPEVRNHPNGYSYYWLGRKLAQFQEDEESDIAWLKKGYATAVPLHINELTDHLHILKYKETFESFVN